jgi:hypothetical protein
MTNRAFNIPRSKDPSKVNKILDAIDIAAKYFVYKLYDATRRDRVQWIPLKGIDKSQATIERAVQRGWAVLQHRTGASLRLSEAVDFSLAPSSGTRSRRSFRCGRRLDRALESGSGCA